MVYHAQLALGHGSYRYHSNALFDSCLPVHIVFKRKKDHSRRLGGPSIKTSSDKMKFAVICATVYDPCPDKGKNKGRFRPRTFNGKCMKRIGVVPGREPSAVAKGMLESLGVYMNCFVPCAHSDDVCTPPEEAVEYTAEDLVHVAMQFLDEQVRLEPIYCECC